MGGILRGLQAAAPTITAQRIALATVALIDIGIAVSKAQWYPKAAAVRPALL
jgi:hypothetical protein